MNAGLCVLGSGGCDRLWSYRLGGGVRGEKNIGFALPLLYENLTFNMGIPNISTLVLMIFTSKVQGGAGESSGLN